jgi:hypothetical protein
MYLDFLSKKIQEIQVIIYMLFAIYDLLCVIYHHNIFCVTNTVRVLFAYFDLFLVFFVHCKWRLHCVNYILSNLKYSTLKYILKIFMKFSLNLEACSFYLTDVYMQSANMKIRSRETTLLTNFKNGYKLSPFIFILS